eukprot:5491543-Amphidinium_carterae.1
MRKRNSGGIRWKQKHPRVRRARRAGGRGSSQLPFEANSESLPSLCGSRRCGGKKSFEFSL